MSNQASEAFAYIEREYKDLKGRVEDQRRVVEQLHMVETDAAEAEASLAALLDEEASKLRILDYLRTWRGDKIKSAGRELLQQWTDTRAGHMCRAARLTRRGGIMAPLSERGPQTHLNEWVSISVRNTPCFVGILRGYLQHPMRPPLWLAPSRYFWTNKDWPPRLGCRRL